MIPYTPEVLKEMAPSIFATKPSPKMTEKYKFVPTDKIIENFEMEGWKVYSAKQQGKGPYSKHELRLRNGEMPMVGDTLVEAIIRNSHDGSTLFSVTSGLHRLVCSNGLTVPTSVSESIRVRHLNFDLGTVKQITDQFAERLPVIQRNVSKMSSQIMSEDQQFDFAKKASLLRWGKLSVPKFNVEEILKPNRTEDVNPTVWNVFNVLQEKFVRGGVSYSTNRGRMTSLRNIKDFQAINKINVGLWELAESYC